MLDKFKTLLSDNNDVKEEEFEASKDLEKPKAIRKAEFLAEYRE